MQVQERRWTSPAVVVLAVAMSCTGASTPSVLGAPPHTDVEIQAWVFLN